MNELNKDLKGQAVALGLCNDWQKLWSKDWSKEKLAERMYRGLDFCLKYHFPSNEYLLKHFGQEFLRGKNIFVDDKYSANNPTESLILGTSEITLRYNGTSYGNIHIRDNAAVRLIARNRSFVLVHLYENGKVTAEKFDKAKIVLVKHSDKVSITADETIKVREEYEYPGR